MRHVRHISGFIMLVLLVGGCAGTGKDTVPEQTVSPKAVEPVETGMQAAESPVAGADAQRVASKDIKPEQTVIPKAVESVASDSRVKEKPSVSVDAGTNQNNAPLTYEVLRGPWKPNEAPQGLGLELLIPESATQDQIIRLLRDLATGKDPVSINLWTNRQVWANAKKNIYDDAYDQHLICVYVKNMTGRGAFAGFNEIRWTQEKGRFSHLFGKTTPMQ